MATTDIDTLALTALRLLPDEPERAMRLWSLGYARASRARLERELFRLHVVKLNHEARFGERLALGPRVVEAAERAQERGWIVEGLLVNLLVIYLGTLDDDHVDDLRELEAMRADAERHLHPIELSWLDLLSGHFRGHIVGWAAEQQCAYQALKRLSECAQAPQGLVANTKMNIGYSHLLVQNIDLARLYLEEAWRLYEPLPMTPRKLSALKAWAQCLLTLGQLEQADAVLRPVIAERWEMRPALSLGGVLLVAAEIRLALGDRALALALWTQAQTSTPAQCEPAVRVHLAYVRALLLSHEGALAGALEVAAQSAEQGCALISPHAHEIAVQSCLQLGARLRARGGDFERAYALQCRLMDMRAELSAKAAEIRHIELHVDYQTHLSQLQIDHARRERALAEAAEAAILQQNQLLEQRLHEVEELRDCLREQANRDALTGLYNRRYLADAMPGLLSRVARQRERITVVLIDLDHFKLVNDRYGHQMGDLVLCGFAELLRDSFRAHDLCCRYGGEEFCVVMADTDDAAARARVAQMLERLSARVFINGERRLTDVGFSAGIASFLAEPRTDMDRVFRRADQALYMAKNAGRRQIASVDWT